MSTVDDKIENISFMPTEKLPLNKNLKNITNSWPSASNDSLFLEKFKITLEQIVQTVKGQEIMVRISLLTFPVFSCGKWKKKIFVQIKHFWKFWKKKISKCNS